MHTPTAPRIGSLFTGYGGLDQAVEQHYGGRTVWTSDVDAGANRIIAHRYPHAPNLGDLTRIPWASVEPVEILTGGFPCTDLSKVGRRAGLRPGTRSGLWTHMAYAINTLRPRAVVAENVRGLLSGEASSDLEPCPWCMGDRDDCTMRALGVVLSDLAELGYDARWTSLRASDVGAPHERERVFLVATPAHTDGVPARPADRGVAGAPREERRRGAADNGHARAGAPLLPGRSPDPVIDGWREYADLIAGWERTTGHRAPSVDADLTVISEWLMGLPRGWVTDVPGLSRSGQLKALGNGVVPQQAAEALRRIG